MPQSRRNSHESNASGGAPPKKRHRIAEPETADATVALDPNAIDHSLDLVPADHPSSHLDSFSLEFFDELNGAAETVMPTLDGAGHPHTEAEEQEDDSKPEDPESPEPPKKKKKKKATAAAPPPVLQPVHKPINIDELKRKYGKNRLERIRRQAIKDAWKEYKEETDRVVMQLPHEITSMFGQLGYGKFGKKWFPMLVICPFDVALETVRLEWYQTFEKALEGRIKFAHCGYWVGETNYSPVGQSNFVPHDKASSSHTSLVEKVKKKMAKGVPPKAGTEDAYLMRAIEEVERLTPLSPEERRKQIPHTRHPFEDMPVDEVLKDMVEKGISVEAFEEDISDDDGLDESMNDVDSVDMDPEPTSAAEQPVVTLDNMEETPPNDKSKSKKKNTKKGKAKKPPANRTEEQAPEKPVPAKKTKVKEPPPDDDLEDSEQEFDDEDIPSDDDKGDDDYDLEAEIEPRNVAADEGLVEDLVRLPKSKGGKRKSLVAKKSSPKKGGEKESKTKASKKKQDVPPKEKNERQKRDYLRKKIQSNEAQVVPILEGLHAVNSETESKNIHELLSNLSKQIEKMCWAFIEIHKVPVALKPAKKELKSRGENASIVADLRDRMKVVYNQSRAEYPMQIAITTCEASYLEGSPLMVTVGEDLKSSQPSRKRDSISRKSAKASVADPDKSSEDPKRDSMDPLSRSDPGVKKRNSSGLTFEPEKVPKKKKTEGDADVQQQQSRRKTMDSLPRSGKGTQSRYSTGSLTKLDKAAKPEYSLEKPSKETTALPVELASKKMKFERKPSGVVEQSDTAAEKRNSLDSLSLSGRGSSKRKESSRSENLGRSSDVGLQRQESVTSLPHLERRSSGNLATDDAGDVSRRSIGTVSRKRNSSQPSTDSGRKSPAKPRPKFSLVGLMKTGSSQERSSSAPSSLPRLSSGSRGVVKPVQQQLPSWMCNEIQPPTLNRNRLFGLEFYKEMARLFPAEKVNRESMAISLEESTHEWATAQSQSEKAATDMYWRKIRALVAVVSGKYDPGSLKQKILKGDFAQAADLVTVPEDELAEYLNPGYGQY